MHLVVNNIVSSAKQDIADCLEKCNTIEFIDDRLYCLLLSILEMYMKGD